MSLPEPTDGLADQPQAKDEVRADEFRAIGRTIRVLVVAFALVRVLDAAGVPVDPLGTLLIALAGLMVLAHVAATVIATTRRNATDAAIELEFPVRPRHGSAIHRASVLHHDLPIRRRAYFWAAAGATVGAAAMAVVTFASWPRIGPLGVAIVEASASVIGGYAGFMTARLTAAASTAFRQAADSH